MLERAPRLCGVVTAALALVVTTVLATVATASVPARLTAWRVGGGASGGANAYQSVLLSVDCARVGHCVAVGYAAVLEEVGVELAGREPHEGEEHGEPHPEEGGIHRSRLRVPGPVRHPGANIVIGGSIRRPGCGCRRAPAR